MSHLVPRRRHSALMRHRQRQAQQSEALHVQALLSALRASIVNQLEEAELRIAMRESMENYKPTMNPACKQSIANLEEMRLVAGTTDATDTTDVTDATDATDTTDELRRLTDQFHTLVPTPSGRAAAPPIDSIERLEAKLEALEALAAPPVAENGDTAAALVAQLPFRLVPMNTTGEAFETLQTMVADTAFHGYGLQVRDAIELVHPQPWAVGSKRSLAFQLLHSPEYALLTQRLSRSTFFLYGKEAVQAVKRVTAEQKIKGVHGTPPSLASFPRGPRRLPHPSKLPLLAPQAPRPHHLGRHAA